MGASCGCTVAFRVGQINGRSGFYVFIDKPAELREKKGSNTIKRKAGGTEAEAKRNAPGIVAKVLDDWSKELSDDPFRDARVRSQATGLPLDSALEDELRARGYKREVTDRLVLGLYPEDELIKQGLTPPTLSRKEEAQLKAAESTTDPWQHWIKTRTIEEQVSASTIAGWESKLKTLAGWLGSDHVGVMTRKQAHSYKLYLLQERGLSTNSVSNMIGTYSGFWNWALRSAHVEGENIWLGLKKGLSTKSGRKPLDAEVLAEAEAKADRLKDVRFWFGRYQGLRKQDYTGLRWSDIDLDAMTINIAQYEWQGQVRTLKTGEDRVVPLHSKLAQKIREFLPEALDRNDESPIWPEDYTSKTHAWGARFSERFKDRYGFGSHDLRALVVTKMLARNISPYFLKHITGHAVDGTKSVIQGYVQPTLEEVRDVLELLD